MDYVLLNNKIKSRIYTFLLYTPNSATRIYNGADINIVKKIKDIIEMMAIGTFKKCDINILSDHDRAIFSTCKYILNKASNSSSIDVIDVESHIKKELPNFDKKHETYTITEEGFLDLIKRIEELYIRTKLIHQHLRPNIKQLTELANPDLDTDELNLEPLKKLINNSVVILSQYDSTVNKKEAREKSLKFVGVKSLKDDLLARTKEQDNIIVYRMGRRNGRFHNFMKFMKYFGFENNRLYLFGAPPGSGKSLLMLNMFQEYSFHSEEMVFNTKNKLNQKTIKVPFYITMENTVTETQDRLTRICLYDFLTKFFKTTDINTFEKDVGSRDEVDRIREKFKMVLLIIYFINSISSIKFLSGIPTAGDIYTNILEDMTNMEKEFDKLHKKWKSYSKQQKEIIMKYDEYLSVSGFMKSLNALLREKRIDMCKKQSESEQQQNQIPIRQTQQEEDKNKNAVEFSYEFFIEIEPLLDSYLEKLDFYIPPIYRTKKPLEVGPIFVDYMDRMTSVIKEKEKRFEIGNVLIEMKNNLAIKFKVPVITASQVNKYEKIDKSNLGIFKESKQKAEHTDFACVFVRDEHLKADYEKEDYSKSNKNPSKISSIRNIEYKDDTSIHLYIQKNRNGKVGNIDIGVYYPGFYIKSEITTDNSFKQNEPKGSLLTKQKETVYE